MSKARNPESQMLFYFMYLGIELFLSNHEPVHWLFFHGNEFWKDVPEYEGFYQISSLGKLKSFHSKKEQILKASPDIKGYLRYTLCRKNSRKGYSVHRLVLYSFKINAFNKPEVNHRNGNKSINTLSNLEWATHQENISHAIKTGLRTKDINLRKQDLFSPQDLKIIRKMFAEGYSNQEICKKFNCVHSTISKIRTGNHYPDPNHPRVNIWDHLGQRNKIIFDFETGIFYENIKVAAKAKNINYQVLTYHLKSAVINKTSLSFI